MTAPTPTPKGHLPHLDALRAVAIVAVLVDHLFPVSHWPMQFAPLGVKLFFVLSGYLITGILLENRCRAAERGVAPGFVLRQFYIRRFLRIFPIYYLAIAVCLVFDIGQSRELWPWLVTYTTNIYMGMSGEWPTPMSHAWSLAVEEQFYIVWPLVMLWLPWKWMFPALVATVAVGSGFKVWAYASGANDFVCWFSTPGSLDSLGAGALLALWQRGPGLVPGKAGEFLKRLPSADFAARSWVPWAGVALVLMAEIPPSMNGTSPLVELTRIAGFSLLVLHASYGFGGLAGRIAENRWVQLTGVLSYGLYLYHPIVHVFCGDALEAIASGAKWLETADPVLALVVSFLVAWISYRFLERPINDLKRHFPYVEGKAAPKRATLNDHSPQVDGLRGLAILMVFFHHSGWKPPHEWDWGQMGVRLFFVLSGYLITLSLWRIEDRAAQLRVGYAGELGIFHLRRFARLLPAFLAALAFGVIVGMEDVVDPLLWHLAFLTNFKIAMQGWFFGPTAHLWSLSLQEQFYILWPFFLLAVPRRWFPFVALGLIAAGYGYRVYCISAGVSDYWRWLMVPGAIDTFAIGGLLAWMKRGPGLPPLPSRPLSIAGLVLLAAAFWAANRVIRFAPVNAWVDSLPEIFEGLVAAILVWGCVKGFPGWLGGFFAARPLRFLGQISYGIFIYHLILFYFMEPHLAVFGIGPKESPVAWSILMFALTFVVSVGSWFWLEKPVVRAAKRFIESRAGRNGKSEEM